MNRRTAEEIVPLLLRAAADVSQTVEVFRAREPENHVKPYSDAIGVVVFAIDGVLRPIITEYPDLHP